MRNKALLRVLAIAITAVICTLAILNAAYPSVSLAQTSTNGMAYAQVNKSGCMVRDGNCQIRLDFYLEPEDVRYYDRYLYLVDETSLEYLAGYPGEVDKDGNPVDQADYDKWWEGLPRVWVNTPFHTHFVYLPADFTEEDIKAQIDIHLGNFYQAFQDYMDEVEGGMRTGWATETRIPPTDYSLTDTAAEYDARVAACEDAIDTLTEFSYKPDGEISGETFPATEIDIGSVAIDRSSAAAAGFTRIVIENPANDTGAIDTFEIWAEESMTGTNKVGTFYGSGTTRTSRDYESIGTVTSGAKRTFTGLDIDVSTNDLAGIYYSVGNIEMSTSGGSGYYYKAGDQFGAGSQTYSSGNSIYTFSLYATGETAGCDPSIELDQSSWSINGGSPVDEDSTYNTGLDWCTITNNSGGAVTIYIQGTDMTGGGYTWDLSDDASNGDMIYGMHAGLSDMQDFTTYTEYDEGSDITITSSTITFTNACPKGDTFYVYSDKGADYFDEDFEHNLIFDTSEIDDGVISGLWVLANQVGDLYDFVDGGYSHLAVVLDYSEGAYLIKLREGYSGNIYEDFYYSFSLSTDYYLTVRRDESIGTYGMLYLYICTGNYYHAGGYNLVDTLSLALHANVNFRYVYGASSYDLGSSSLELSGYVKNLDLGTNGEADSFNVIVKESTTNALKAGLADLGTQDFGLQIYTPTNFDDGNNKSGTITLTAVCD